MTARDVTLHSSLVFELRSPQCLLTPMLTLNDFIFSFFFPFRDSAYFHSRMCVSREFCFFICHLPRMKTKAGAQFAWLKVKLHWTVSLNNNDKIVNFRRTNTYVSKFNAKRKKKRIRLNRNLFQVFLFTQGRWKCFLKCSSSLSTVLNTFCV